MARPHEKLAESLEALHALQPQQRIAIRSGDLSEQPDGVSPRFHDFLVSAIPDFF